MNRQADLTHAEARAAFRELAERIGPRCGIHPGINSHGIGVSDLHAAVYPEGIAGSGRFNVSADSYRELIEQIEAQWEERGATYVAKTIRDMALAIISITADQGECTDAALRATFDAADVARYGERACAQATEMASNGPFSIVKLAGANQNEAA